MIPTTMLYCRCFDGIKKEFESIHYFSASKNSSVSKMRLEATLILIFSAFNYETASGGHWTYNKGRSGPSHWEGLCAFGEAQSPVILQNEVFDSSLASQPLQFRNYESHLKRVRLTNNGHTMKMSLETAAPNFTASVEGGGLRGTFRFAQLHFHWGATSASGSEHRLNEQAYPLEVHLVHYNDKYEFKIVSVRILRAEIHGQYCLQPLPVKDNNF